MLKQVFISYRHESDPHARSVRRLGELLRRAQIPVVLDQFLLADQPGGPDCGWPKWCEDAANHSDCVLVIASRGWFDAWNETAPPFQGLGAASEAGLFRQALWDEKRHNPRIRLAFLDDLGEDAVPVGLRAWLRFRPFESDAQLDQLIRWIAGRLERDDIQPPPVRWPQQVEFQPNLADRNDEWPAVVELLAGRSSRRIVLIQGASGLGKTALLEQTAAYAAQLGLPVANVNLKSGILDVAGILGQLDLDLGAHLPSFSREGASKTHLLRKDLRALRQPVLLILDHYDRDVIGNRQVVEWLNQHLLPEVASSPALAVVVAGQETPDWEQAAWGRFAHHLALRPITEIRHWEAWVDRSYPAFRDKGAHLPTVLMATGGMPVVMSTLVKTIAKS